MGKPFRREVCILSDHAPLSRPFVYLSRAPLSCRTWPYVCLLWEVVECDLAFCFH